MIEAHIKIWQKCCVSRAIYISFEKSGNFRGSRTLFEANAENTVNSAVVFPKNFILQRFIRVSPISPHHSRGAEYKTYPLSVQFTYFQFLIYISQSFFIVISSDPPPLPRDPLPRISSPGTPEIGKVCHSGPLFIKNVGFCNVL